MNRLGNAKNGIKMGIINNLLNYLLPFASRTIIIYKLGNDYLGLGSLLSSVIQMLNLSELGFSMAISYLLYKPIAKHDTERINALLSFYRTVYRFTGSFIILLSILLIPFIPNLIEGSYPSNINIYILYFIYVFNTAVSYFLFGYKRILLSAHQRYDIEMNIATIVSVLQSVLQIVLLLFFSNYYLYVIVLPLMTIVSNIIYSYITSKKYPEYKCEGSIEKEELFAVVKSSIGAFFSKIGSTVYLSVDNIVISAFLGLSILGTYCNYYYIITTLISIFATIHNTIRPIIGNIIATETKQYSWKVFNNIQFVYMWLVVVCCSCCMVLFQPFEFLWGGASNVLDFSIVVLLVIYFYSGRLYSIMAVYQEAAGILWQGKFIPIIAAIVNLVLNIYLIQIIGLHGVLISSIVSSLIVYLPGNIYIVKKYLFNGILELKHFVISMFLSSVKAIICIVLNLALCSLIKEINWINLFLQLFITLIFTNLLLVVMNLNNSEFKNVISFIKERRNLK